MHIKALFIKDYKILKNLTLSFDREFEYYFLPKEDNKDFLDDNELSKNDFETDFPQSDIDNVGKWYRKRRKNPVPKEFYGENIENIICLVGENGTGKSTIFDLIYKPQEKDRFLYKEKTCHTLPKEDNNKKDFVYYSSILLNNIKTKFGSNNVTNNNNPTVLNYPLGDTILFKNNNLSVYDCYNYSNFLNLLKIPELQKIVNNFLPNNFPTHFKIFQSDLKYYNQYHCSKKTLLKNISFQALKWYEELIYKSFAYYISLKDFSQSIEIELEKLQTTEELKEYFDNISKGVFSKMYNLLIENLIEKQPQIKYNSNVVANFEFGNIIYLTLKVYDNFDYEDYKWYFQWSFCRKLIHLEIIKQDWQIHSSKFKTEIHHDETFEFSSGELELFNFIYLIYINLNNNKTVDQVFLDEPDTLLHPNLSRYFIQIIIEICKLFVKRTFQVFITTHSPIMLSDLHPSSVIRLEKDKKIISASHPDKSTFGANIFQLYKDSFFLKVMIGEFAKNKIDELIKRINKFNDISWDNKTKCKQKFDLEKIQNDIEIIGDEHIKTVLHGMIKLETSEARASYYEKLAEKIRSQ